MHLAAMATLWRVVVVVVVQDAVLQICMI